MRGNTVTTADLQDLFGIQTTVNNLLACSTVDGEEHATRADYTEDEVFLVSDSGDEFFSYHPS